MTQFSDFHTGWSIKIKMNRFLSVTDVSDPNDFVQKALEVKQNPLAFQDFGKDKTIGLIFFNPSLRTRLSSQKAAFHLGANCWVLNVSGDTWKLELEDGSVMTESQEHIKEAIRVMNAYCDILAVRTFPTLEDREKDYSESLMKKIVQNATVPVVSLESATRHPLQSLADSMTIQEHRNKDKIKIVLSWAPHPKRLPQCVANSFLEWAHYIPNSEIIITHPKGYDLHPDFAQNAQVMNDQNLALSGADFVYAKNWSAYEPYGSILSEDDSWMITSEKMERTNNGKFMHCLPIRRNVIASDKVMDSDYSLVIQQAENRIYSAQTVFLEMLKNLYSIQYENRRI